MVPLEEPILPFHQTGSASNSNTRPSNSKTQLDQSGFTQRPSRQEPSGSDLGSSPTQKDNQQATIITREICERYVHWCVGLHRSKALNHVKILKLNDEHFIRRLIEAYRRTIGWRWYFSHNLRQCEIRFRM